MPEDREDLASFLMADFMIRSFKAQGLSFRLRGIWVDATNQEQESAPKNSPQGNGHVYRLSPDTKIERGSRSHQTAVWPSLPDPDSDDTSKSVPLDLDDLELRGISNGCRALKLDFGQVWLQVAYLTHTSCQIFHPKQKWTNSVCVVDKNTRGWKVAMALEFDDWVLCFPSLDMLFQPTWAKVEDKLPMKHINIIDRNTDFLAKVVDWIAERQHGRSTREGLACEVMRKYPKVWQGIGVYTVCELFFIAGISIFLTEAEVFNNPSRTARLCEAFYSYSVKSRNDLWSLLRPCIYNGILAPTQAQRMLYASWLYVYAKDRSVLPKRMAKLRDDYVCLITSLEKGESWTRHETYKLYDVYEPTYSQSALRRVGNLGHLIFGNAMWKTFTGQLSPADDPLTKFFKDKGANNEPTHLHPDIYSTCFLSQDELIGKRNGYPRTTYSYQAQKQLWSIVPNFPDNSSHGLPNVTKPKQNKVNSVIGKQRQSLLFANRVKSPSGVAIGPLEYCSTGDIYRMPWGHKEVAICKADPSINAHFAKQIWRGLERKKEGLDALGKRKGAMSDTTRAKRKAKEVELFGDFIGSSSLPTDSLPANKKRRVSAERSIAVMPEDLANAPRMTRSTNKSQ